MNQNQVLSVVMAAIPDAVLAIDKHERLVFYNPQFAVIFGQNKPLKNPDVRLVDVFRDPDIVRTFREVILENQNRSHSMRNDELTTKKFFSISVSPLREESGRACGAIAVFHDITELKHAEQLRIDFVANVSHELRTPLTAIKGYSDTLLSDIQAGKSIDAKFIEVIHRNTERLMSLIDDLLDLSAIETQVEVQKDDVSTVEVTNRVLNQLQNRFFKKRQKIETQFLTPKVLAQLVRLEQVLTNLLENASKYTPEDGKIIIRWKDNLAGFVCLEVEDNGVGIAFEYQPRLFERFYRVDKARAREQGGTGLGLAIVKHILLKHGGSVSVTSNVGKGSTFTCCFPA